MPIKRKYGRKRSYGGRKYRRSFKKRVRSVILNLAEKKRYTHSVLSEEITSTGHRVYLSNIAQGAGEGDRIGRMVRVHALQCNGEWRETSGAADARSVCTMALVRDRQTVGDAHAAVSEIFSANGTANAPFGLMNVNNKGRFSILKRQQTTVGVRSTDSGLRPFRFYYKFKKPFNMRYNGTAGTDIEANDLMLVFITSNLTAEDGIYMSCEARIWFTDL